MTRRSGKGVALALLTLLALSSPALASGSDGAKRAPSPLVTWVQKSLAHLVPAPIKAFFQRRLLGTPAAASPHEVAQARLQLVLDADHAAMAKLPVSHSGYQDVSSIRSAHRLHAVAKALGLRLRRVHAWPKGFDRYVAAGLSSYGEPEAFARRDTKARPVWKVYSPRGSSGPKIQGLIFARGDQYFFADVFADGRLAISNHDLSLGEIGGGLANELSR
ncbi:MAG: hypothetical protein IT371_04905 [Deltaproteobacteria bacterium]|nr:hypothetical protein [Deltaproteobacteria bacterium]